MAKELPETSLPPPMVDRPKLFAEVTQKTKGTLAGKRLVFLLLLLLLLLFDAGWERSHVYVETTLRLIGREPSTAKNSSPSRAPKTGAQLQTTWRSAKNAQKPPKKTLPTAMPQYSEVVDQLRQQDLHNRDIDHQFKCTATAGPSQFSDV